jgi:Protein of unknown function (DUF2911)
MTKSLVFTLFLSLLTVGLFAQIKTPASSPAAVVSQKVGLTQVTVEYSRPSVKKRKIFGNLVPYGKVWRTGANKITNIKFDNDVMVNGEKIPAGTYGLATIPNKTEWTIIFNSDNKQWGVYEYDEKKDVKRISVKPTATATVTENFTIDLEQTSGTTMNVIIAWEKTSVKFKVEHDPHEQIVAEIKEKTAKADCTTDTYFDAADYYFEKGLDLNQAYAWAEKVVEKDQKYWTYELHGRIAAKLGKCDVAKEDAKKCIEMAKKDNDEAYVKKGEAIQAKCGK